MLLEIASLLEIHNDDTTNLRTRVEATRIPVASFQYWSLRCNEAFEQGRFHDLAMMLMGLNRAHWTSRAQKRISASPLAPFSGQIEEVDRAALNGEAVMLAAFLLCALSGGSPSELAARWTEDLRASEDGLTLQQEVDRASRAFSVDNQRAQHIFADREADFLARLGAVCRILAEQNRAPALSARSQSVALLWLMQSGGQLTFDGMMRPIARHFAKMWRMHLAVPALLISPRTSVPLLHDAIESTTNAPTQLLKLFDAAEAATGVKAPARLRQQLRIAAKAHAARMPW